MSLLDAPPPRPINPFSFADRVAVEGDYVGGGISFNSTDYTSVSLPSDRGSMATALPDRALWVESATVVANKNMLVSLRWGKTQGVVTGSAPAWTHSFANLITTIPVRLVANVPVTVPIRTLIRPLGQGNVRLWVESFVDADKTGTLITVGMNTGQITDDLNYEAKRTGLVIGDSISNGTGVSYKSQMMVYKLISRLKAQGINMRYINNSTGGFTSYDAEQERQFGRFDYQKIDYLVYAHGVNNSILSIEYTGTGGKPSEPTAYMADLQAMYAHARAHWGASCKFIVLGATPLGTNLTGIGTPAETILATIRTAASNWVTAQNDPNLFFLNLAGAGTFDRTTLTNYLSSDGIHPTVIPSATVDTNIIGPWVTANITQLKS